MSISLGPRWRTTRRRVETARSVAYRVLFGTRLGFTLFLGTVCFLGLYWRIGVLVNDNYTLANALVSLADGQFVVEEAVYGPSLNTPGMGEYGGDRYGRNYGHLALALPLLWALEGTAHVADFGVVFPMLWSLLIVGLGVEVGRVAGRESLGASVGAVVGLAAFLANVAVARPLSVAMLPLAALQLSTIVATALAGTTFYRLIARIYDHRTGLVAGFALVTATPVGFWGSIPKQHTIGVLVVTATCYAFFRARQEPSPGALLSPLGFRALSYVPVGLMTWINPGEAFAVFVALVAVDLPTAPSNDGRSLGAVGGAFALSMVPFFATNVAVSGDPLRPPRMLSKFGDVTGDVGIGGGGSGGWIPAFAESVLLPILPAVVAGPLSEVVNRVDILVQPFVAGVETVVFEPNAVYRTFVRGGYIQEVATMDLGQAINLAFLESAPLAAGLAAVAGTIAVGWRSSTGRGDAGDRSGPLRGRLRGIRDRFVAIRTDPLLATDALVTVVGVSFTLVYIQRFPLHAQITVRYLVPLCPLVLYGLVRQPSLRRALAAHGRTGLWTWLAGVLVGSQLFLAAYAAASLGRGEAFQVHALAGLAVAGSFGALAFAGAFTERFDRLTAATAGLAAALGTDFLLLSGLVYFQYGQYALPAVGWIAEVLARA